MCELPQKRMTPEVLWESVKACEGQQFFTAKGLPFQYTIKGGEMIVDRREKAKSITRSTVFRAYEKLWNAKAAGEPVSGPKKLGVFGAPYIWSILTAYFRSLKFSRFKVLIAVPLAYIVSAQADVSSRAAMRKAVPI